MTVGPLLMAAGMLWLARIPADSEPWLLSIGDPGTYLPPTDYLVDILPGSILFGLGLAIMVAPLTTALMRSMPGRQAGVASAINNAISRVGPQLAGAVIFIIVTASFYSMSSPRAGPGRQLARGSRAASAAQRAGPAVPPETPARRREASTQAFHLAMLGNAVLLVMGAAVNVFGIDNRQALAPADPLESASSRSSPEGQVQRTRTASGVERPSRRPAARATS